MKSLAITSVIFVLFLYSACSDGNCEEDIIGIYEGVITCSGGQVINDISFEIVSTELDNEIIIDLNTILGSPIYEGSIQNCNSILIHPQDEFVDINGNVSTVQGELTVESNQLTGQLISVFPFEVFIDTCTWNFIRVE